MQTHRLMYLFLTFFIVTATIALATQKTKIKGVNQTAAMQPLLWTQKDEERKKNFPTADFVEAEPTEPTKRAALKEKQIRHNGLGLVSRNPDSDTSGAAFLPEGQFDFPALPVAKSDAILLGEVVSAEAHVSEDKTSVFSEFDVRVERILKPFNSSLNGSFITIERVGGYVKYPGGRKLLYQVGSAGMPRVGGRYVFFLNTISKSPGYSILTGYLLSHEGVSPLDSSVQFDAYTGYDEVKFLAAVNDALTSIQTP